MDQDERNDAVQDTRSGRDRRAGRRSAADRRRIRNRIGAAVLTFLLAGTATVYGCNSDRIAGPSAPPASARPNATIAGATTVTETGLPGEETNSCNGELVPYEGKVSYGMFATDGGTFHQRVKLSYVFKGTGALGNVYHGASEYSEELNISTHAEWTFNHEVRMTSQTAPDFRLHYVAHVKVSATGDFTVTFEKGPRIDCNR
jgi:hypothetical protein